MTVFQHVKDLIGKEDVNWGDSSSTFARETHTGGSVNISYIDAEIIPSTTLGGYIGDHLHEQNTDTGTTAATFKVDSDGNYAELSASGLSADRTFTFPDTGNQELIGSTDLASTSNGLGAALVGIEDSAGLLSSTDVESALAEIAQDVADITHPHGYKYGFDLNHSSDDAITIGAGMWSLWTDSYSLVYTNESKTFTLGSAGSNGTSEDLGNSTLYYIYIDESASTASLITVDCFRNHSTAPTFNSTRKGWMNTSNDRCIGAVLTDGTADILDFDTFGNFYRYAVPITEFSVSGSGVNYQSVDVSSSVPIFATRVRIQVATNTANTLYFDTSSSSSTPEGHYLAAGAVQTFDIQTNSSQVFYFKGTSDVNTTIYVVGYYLDKL